MLKKRGKKEESGGSDGDGSLRGGRGFLGISHELGQSGEVASVSIFSNILHIPVHHLANQGSLIYSF